MIFFTCWLSDSANPFCSAPSPRRMVAMLDRRECETGWTHNTPTRARLEYVPLGAAAPFDPGLGATLMISGLPRRLTLCNE